MSGVLVAALIIIPFVELVVLLQIADAIGVIPTLLVLVAVSVVGAYLLGREGMATWRRLRAAIARGEMPTDELIDGGLILFGGALLLTPGFVTDFLGLTLLVPGARGVWRKAFRAAIGWMVVKRFGRKAAAGIAGKRVYDARVTGVRRVDDAGEAPPTSTRPPSSLPGRARPHDAGDSRDTG